MTCLGERLTALVDGELDHDERDRALAHLAVCRTCREEADTMRRLKSRLRALSAPPAPSAPDLPDTGFLDRLRALGDQPPV
ncbi:MAG TPA: zf-HC2 domain-containing protein, partial [Thermomonospora sp.]|nr:zf-HC2 domain-containing protein [Thermomonospora sp.]